MNKDELRERAYRDCIKYGTPTPGVDHNNHYRPIEELIEIARQANIQETE